MDGFASIRNRDFPSLQAVLQIPLLREHPAKCNHRKLALPVATGIGVLVPYIIDLTEVLSLGI
jgi:hypothetical protein